MALLEYEEIGGVRVARMCAPKGNAIGAPLLAELERMLAEAEGALVLARDSPGVFSSGFDAHEVFSYTREEMRDFFTRFLRFCGCMRRHPYPVVAALGGHTVAGGALVACAADFRVMAASGAAVRIKALDLGVVLPPSLVRLLEDAAGKAWAMRLLLAGETLLPHEALESGFAAELTATGNVVGRAVARARDLSAKPAAAFAASKRTFAGPPLEDDLTPFLDFWFGEEASRRREWLLRELAGR
jgi:enoyl-CoA hydratase/carnithine racemase